MKNISLLISKELCSLIKLILVPKTLEDVKIDNFPPHYCTFMDGGQLVDRFYHHLRSDQRIT